ncbi:thermonuclease family protein [Yimella sp. cx-51]|nr:thermonuclease family protein [Yimella sp. cx-51]QTH39597.1 thermonuclease family protein [Yimella sp. cx-51]
MSAAVLALSAGLLAGCQTGGDVASVVSPTSTTTTAAATPVEAAAEQSSTAAAAETPASATSAAPTAPTTSSTRSAAPEVAATAGALHQVAGIVDGDTIKVWIGGTRVGVRLLGVDTPETVKPGYSQGCFGKQASSKMQSLVQSKQVHLVPDATQGDKDRYGRLLRYVLLPDGRDVSQQMIAGGFGREYTYAAAYAKQGTFRAAQSSAQAARAGLWGACTYESAFNPPATSSTPTAPLAVAPSASSTTAAQAPAGTCNIKGNINSKGEKIYHRPGQQAYDKTVITPSKGERMFCSESEAQAAGWRAAKR